MKVKTSRLTETTQGFCDIIDITAKIAAQVREAQINDGLLTVFVSGSTAALTTIEHEPGLVQDLKDLLEQLISSNTRYHHDERWGDENGFSHLRATLFGLSLQIPIERSRLALGTWQHIILLDFDNRPRTRDIVIQLIGGME